MRLDGWVKRGDSGLKIAGRSLMEEDFVWDLEVVVSLD